MHTIFENMGGQFLATPQEILDKYKSIKGILFDWDGVFNNGQKSAEKGSNYSEADSAGTNLLRFGKWLQTQQHLKVGIITGASNATAFELANREHFDAVYSKITDKSKALAHFCTNYQLQTTDVACFFDDAIDLSMAKNCHLRFLIRRKASPLFEQFVVKNGFCDYISGLEGGQNAVREICEMLLGLSKQYENVLFARMNFDENYQTFFTQRNQAITSFFTSEGQNIVLHQPEKTFPQKSVSH